MSSWRFLDLASPYVDYVLDLTAEVLDRYAPVDGIFFDIVRQSPLAQRPPWHVHSPGQGEIDGRHDSLDSVLQIERRFLGRASELVRRANPAATVFFNSRLRPDRFPELGSRAELPWYSHIEIESLPSGEWGYNHYPLFAAYFQTLEHPLVGMTGVFHTSWGDFGAIKPQAALDYECSRMIATGAACSIGDHLHPSGVLDSTTYKRIQQTYSKIDALEPWCRDAQPVTEIGIVLAESGERFNVTGRDSDEGAMRMMLELHRPFQFIDLDADLSPYKVVILPDTVAVSDEYADHIKRYLSGGGSILLTHQSGLGLDGTAFAPFLSEALGIQYVSEAPHSPDFLVVAPALDARLGAYHQVLHERGSLIESQGAEVLAHMGLPFFSRTPEHFFGHRQAPFRRASRHPSITQHGRGIYCHSPLFRAYRRRAIPAYRDLIGVLLERLIPDPVLQTSDMPSTAEVQVLQQPSHDDRYVVHIVHAVPQRRGEDIDIVEDVLPLRHCRVGVRAGRQVDAVMLAPGEQLLSHETEKGVTWVTVPDVNGHQVIVFS
jgi:hypothetical protein